MSAGTTGAGDARAAGARVRFTEEMKGFVAFGESDFARGYERGRGAGAALKFHLTIETPAIDAFAADPMRLADASGWVHCEELGGTLPIGRGDFNLFVDSGRPGEKRMLYRLHFADAVGHPLTLAGHKLIADDPGIDLWPDTTTLFTRLLTGHVEAGGDDAAEFVASGILHISPLAFARQLTTFRATGSSLGGNLAALLRFNVLFCGELWRIYGLRPGKWRR